MRAYRRSKSRAQLAIVIAAARAGLEQLQGQKRRLVARLRDRQDLGHPDRLGLGQPGQAASLGREHARVGAGVGLDEHLAAVGQGDRVGLVDVAAAERARPGDLAAQGGG
jgi:hypothetical protein